MAIKKIRDRYQVDFRHRGKRYRGTFDSREDARSFKTQIQYGIKSDESDNGKPVFEAIERYMQIVSVKNITSKKEIGIFEEFYDYLTDELDIFNVKEIELVHLEAYQTHLSSGTERVRVWEESEANRKKQALRRKEPYVARKMPRGRDQGLSPSSINRKFGPISHLLRSLKKWKWINSNPAAELERLPSSSVPHKPWDNEDIKRAIKIAKPWDKGPYFLIAATGIRPICACRLAKSDVDLRNREFFATNYKGKGGVKRRQRIAMTDEVYVFFLKWFEYLASRPIAPKYRHLIFPSATGVAHSTEGLSERMGAITKKLGLKGHTLYGFRHSFATDASNPSTDGTYSGNIEVGRQLLGHSSISQTQVYNHTKQNEVSAEAQKLSTKRGFKWDESEQEKWPAMVKNGHLIHRKNDEGDAT